ncbi:DUF3566 domain-containing protein [Streptomyces anandii]|uniref:DUF3566 domain-containing protein n=1 Tax=Streptomyces anandii TaxID=285454 RepID=A0ABW6HGH3_9ACTN
MSPARRPRPAPAAELPGLTDAGEVTAVADPPGPPGRDDLPEDPLDPLDPPPSQGPLPVHISGTDPRSVLRVGSWALFGFGVCVSATLGVVWIVLKVTGQDPWLPAGWALLIAVAAVAAEVVLGTALATLVAVLYNLTSSHAGGLRMTLSDEDPEGASGPLPSPLPDVARVLGRVRARLGFPPAGSGARYVEFADRCGRARRRLRERAARRLTGFRTALRARRDRTE